MEIGVGLLLGVVFCYINYKIIQSDFLYKRIPNVYLKMLLLLLIFWYVYAWFFGYFYGVSVLFFGIQVLLTFIISFGLFSYKIWGAGDAKYLLVLGLYIPHIGIIPFIVHISVITLGYLSLYFIWFWFGINLWIPKRRKSLYENLWEIKKKEFLNYMTGKSYKIFLGGILKKLYVFFLFFTLLRLIKVYLIEYLENTYNISFFEILTGIFEYKAGIYLICIGGFILFGIAIGIKLLYSVLQRKLPQKKGYIPLLLFNAILIIFLIFEYIKDSGDLFQKLVNIFTLYLCIYLGFKILLFSYKLVFIYTEEEMIPLYKLKQGLYVSQSHIKKQLGEKRTLLGFFGLDLEDFLELSEQNIIQLKKVVRFSNKNILKNRKKEDSIHGIFIVKTGAFAPIIFLGLLLSIFLQGDSIFQILFQFLSGYIMA